jgi:arylsulfatase
MHPPTRPKALARIAASLCLLVLCGCEHERRPPNIVLIVVDTLRRDAVGCYGASKHDTTPHLDALAQEAVRFDHAYATAPWTCPSVASILTGQLPSTHGLTAALTGLGDGVDSLAEMLKAEGYATAGVISNPHIGRRFGFAQGFDTWAQDQAKGHQHVSTPGVTREAIDLVRKLARGEKPFFLFVLYFDPHYDYKRHPEYGFAGDPGRITGKEHIIELEHLAPTMTETEIRYLRDVYDEEVRFTDEGIGRLLGALRESGAYDDTAIVVTADHGEEFVERGWIGHVRTLYGELVHIPLLVRRPGETARVVDTKVSLVSLVPTLRQLAGLTPEIGRADAPSLVPLLDGGRPASWPPLFCEVDYSTEIDPLQEAHKRAVVDGGYKLIHDDTTGKNELYDLAQDPGERHDLAEAQPEVTRRMYELLERVHAAARAGAAAHTDVQLDEEDLEAFRALGYAGSGAPSESPPEKKK